MEELARFVAVSIAMVSFIVCMVCTLAVSPDMLPQDMDADHSCSCVNGFTGRDCEVTINTCQGVLCSGNGRCMEAGAGSYTCVCGLGYTGDLCGTRLPSTTTPSGTTAPSTPLGITTPSGNLTGVDHSVNEI